ncbi:MAG: hypothetical protein E6772_08450 [Dysgonomonas sp.]|nr:hypothetical protein [Dysgonomonas sp.]
MVRKSFYLFVAVGLALTSCSHSESLLSDEEASSELRIDAEMTKFTYEQTNTGGAGLDSQFKWWTEVWLDQHKGKVFNVQGGYLTHSTSGITNKNVLDYIWNAKKESTGTYYIYTRYNHPYNYETMEMEYRLDPATGTLKPIKKLTEMGPND